MSVFRCKIYKTIRVNNTSAISARFVAIKTNFFAGFVSYIVLSVYYIVRAILVNIFIEHIDFEPNIVALIIFAVISLIPAVFLFLLYKKTKHIDLGEK